MGCQQMVLVLLEDWCHQQVQEETEAEAEVSAGRSGGRQGGREELSGAMVVVPQESMRLRRGAILADCEGFQVGFQMN
jgi:hypothetical protein